MLGLSSSMHVTAAVTGSAGDEIGVDGVMSVVDEVSSVQSSVWAAETDESSRAVKRELVATVLDTSTSRGTGVFERDDGGVTGWRSVTTRIVN